MNEPTHIPFDNPETEAYWNRPCRHGKYPYPDENVFLVSGGKFLGQHLVFLGESSIIVSLTPQLAQEYWVDVANVSGAKTISCLSLAQAKKFQNQLEQLIHSPAGCVKIKSSLINALFFKSEIFWVVGTDAQGVSIEKPVQAVTVKDILAWAEHEHIQVAGILSASALSETLRDMEKVQQGVWEGREHYAYDYAHGEDLRESDVMIAMESIEEKDEFDKNFLLDFKDNPSCSPERYKELEAIVKANIEARHRNAEGKASSEADREV